MPSEYPDKDARTVPFQSETKEAVLVRPVTEPTTRYADLPLDRPDRGGTRNLAWGIAFLALAAIGFWLGLYYAGAAAARTLIACLLTFGVVWLLLHLNVLRQRYGALFGLGLVAVIGAAIPFVEGGFRRLDNIARESLAGQTPSVAALSVPPPPPTTATAPPAPPTIPLPEDIQDATAAAATPDASAPPAPKGPAKATRSGAAPEPAKAALATTPAGPDGLRELLVPEPPPGSGKLIRVKEDVKVDLDGRPTVIRAGTIAPFKELNDGQVIFIAGDHEISISMDLVTFTGATKEKTEDINLLAQQEAMHRYPRLRDTESREYNLYMIRVAEFKNAPEMKEIFTDPKWPLVLAEQLAQQEHWVRADLPPDEAAAAAGAEKETPSDATAPGVPANELPANQLPAKGTNELLLPSRPAPIPQEAEPPPAK
jgi:hypothetical protein